MQPFDPIAALIVVIGLCMVGLTDFRSSAVLYGLHSTALGVLAVAIGHQRGEALLLWVGAAVILLKGIGVPAYLIVVARRIGCRRDVGMVVAPPLQFFLAVAGLSLLVLLRPLHAEFPASTLPSLGILLIGMLLMATRRLAVSQILGFLVLENGIFLYTIAQPHSMPLVVEIGVLMDVLTATMLCGLLAFRINRSFEHIDVAEMRDLQG